MPKFSSVRQFPLTSGLFLLGVGIGIYVNLATTDDAPWYVYPALTLLVLVGFLAEIIRHRREEQEKKRADVQLGNIEEKVVAIHEVISLEKVFRLPPNRIQVSSLPELQPHFTAREKELDLLDAAWADSATNIVQFIAPGGTGKTTLVTYWLQYRLPKNGVETPEMIYAWSFYSQGTDDQRQSSSDLFFQRAGDFFEAAPLPTDPRERGKALAGALRRRRCLLILDGIEPLQHAPGPLEGELKDPALRALLKELVFGQPGLCVLTTRLSVKELEGIAEPAHRRHYLENLSPETGAQLLRSIGVTGSEKDLRAAVTEYKGHTLALRLLGNYLADLLDGDVRQRDRIPHLTDDERAGGHARRVMEAYVAWFESSERSDWVTQSHPVTKAPSPEVALLQLLGLFDRPAPVAALDALVVKPVIIGLTEGLRDLDPIRLKKALNHLKKLGLLSENRLPGPTLPKGLKHLNALSHLESLDAHPLVREHFGQQLETDNPAAWRVANARLYDYYRNLPEKYLPDTLEEMEPLFWAMAHGCRAGKQQEVFNNLYYKRILRKKDTYVLYKLGAFGSNLTALSHLFEKTWDKPSRNLSQANHKFVLQYTGFNLRVLGRLREAVQPMQLSMEMALNKKEWKYAAIGASSLCELCLTYGDLKEAFKYGKLSVKYAYQCRDTHQIASSIVISTNVLCQTGNFKEMKVFFEEAEAIQKNSRPGYPYLYSLQGFLYCDLLLQLGKGEEVLKRAGVSLKISTLNNWLFHKGLDFLSLGRAHALLAQETSTDPHCKDADHYLILAVETLRKAGDIEYVARGLLARAAWHCHCARFDEAETDLQEAFEIAENGSMGLYLVDYHLEMGRLRRAQGRDEEAEKHKAEALRRVKETGYLRRLKEAEEV